MAINRRKAHRKAKRRAERKRRKELAAAGLDENGINGTAAEAALKDKLSELDEKHRTKKRRNGNVSVSKTKVKRWANGLRRRKGEETINVIEEEPTQPKTPSLHTISDVMAGDTTSSESPRSSSPTEPSPETSQETMEGPFLPPEYRPASVHSQRAGGSRQREAEETGSSTMDKTRAPGYYPAPATRDGEEAMEVVSRAEGKRPLPPPQEEVRHIATDDKRVLEQMRLGASAPPASDEAEAGPSAPHVEVDQDGFERADDIDMSPVMPPTAPLHPDIPAPPQPTLQRFDSPPMPSAPPVAAPLDTPSAPPAPPSEPSSPPAPSAPPLLEEPVPEPSAPTFTPEEDGELESEQPHAEPEVPRLFLPKYEP